MSSVIARVRTGAIVGLLLLGAFSSGVRAEDPCSTFKWPVAVERDWFAADRKVAIEANGSLAAVPSEALAVSLARPEHVTFAVPPKRGAKPDSGNAVISIGSVGAAGHYQVTLSEEAWVDIVQNGVVVQSTDFSGVHGCPGVRKSVKFDLQPGAAILQISSSPGLRMNVAIRRVE